MIRLAIAFTNFGPYHVARLRALGERLRGRGGELIAHEMASREEKYPWTVDRGEVPFSWRTLFPGRSLEALTASECTAAMRQALDRDDPDIVAVVGYARPESMAALRWAERRGRPAILLSESQKIDAPRAWWKEAIKTRRVKRFSAGLVGGPRHRDYLADLGMPGERIALGYNAVDHSGYASRADQMRRNPSSRPPGLAGENFLSVGRFAPEKNLINLLHAYALYRADADPARAWNLVLCGGGPLEAEVDALAAHLGIRHFVHRPGFLDESGLAPHYAFSSGFILPSRVEPWGLVANEAAASGLPLLISDRCGCVDTLVPEAPSTGRRFDPHDVEDMAGAMAWLAGLDPSERQAMGRRAREVASTWGPARFAKGLLEAVEMAMTAPFRAARGLVGARS